MIKNRRRALPPIFLVCLLLSVSLTASPSAAGRSSGVQGQLDALVDMDEMTGAVAHVDDRQGRRSSYRAGTARRGTG